MFRRQYIFITIFIVLVQLFFSFYFNSQIINLNQRYSQINGQIITLEKSNQILENQYTQATSLLFLAQESSSSAYFPIQQNIDLSTELP